MRTQPALFLLALGASACGGNWSNQDLEFANALPVRADLESRVPGSASAGQRLEAAGGIQRRDPLLGDDTYAKTVAASDGFNSGIDNLLAAIEAVRTIPPTSRDGDRRAWGPYPTKDQPGFEVRVVMDRLDPRDFEYRIEFHSQAGGQWFAVVVGSFLADSDAAGARKWSGALTLLARQARDHGLPTPNIEAMDTLDIAYSTAGDPVYVAMDTVLMPGQVANRASVKSWRASDGGGQLTFSLVDVMTLPDLAGPHTVTVTSRWNASADGFSETKVAAGTNSGATLTDCWNRDGIFWSSKSWTAAPVEPQPPECVALMNRPY